MLFRSGDVPSGLVLRGAGVAGAVAEGGQDPLPRPRQRRQEHAPAHAQGRGRDKITSFFFLSLSKLLVCVSSSGDGWMGEKRMFTLSSKVAALWEFRVLFRFETTLILTSARFRGILMIWWIRMCYFGPRSSRGNCVYIVSGVKFAEP